MKYDLRSIAKRAGARRSKSLRDIAPPATLAGNLYRSVYRPVIQAWSGFIPQILDTYARSLSELTQDSSADAAREFEAMEQELSRLLLLIGPRLTEWALQVEKWQRGKWIGAVLSASGVDLKTMLGVGDVRATLENTIARNLDLVKDVSAQAKQRMSTAVYDGLRNRTPARDVAKELRKAVDMGRDRSLRIASDQLTKVTGALNDERRNQAGLSEWHWKHSGKARPRHDHKARDGKLYSDDPKQVGKVIAGQTVLKPPQDRPSQLPYCGCRALAYLNLD